MIDKRRREEGDNNNMINLFQPTDLFAYTGYLPAFPAPESMSLGRTWVPGQPLLIKPSQGKYEFLRIQTHTDEDGNKVRYIRCWDHTSHRAILFFVAVSIENDLPIPERLQRKNDVIQERLRPSPFTDR
jgi:hypothetical protein